MGQKVLGLGCCCGSLPLSLPLSTCSLSLLAPSRFTRNQTVSTHFCSASPLSLRTTASLPDSLLILSVMIPTTTLREETPVQGGKYRRWRGMGGAKGCGRERSGSMGAREAKIRGRHGGKGEGSSKRGRREKGRDEMKGRGGVGEGMEEDEARGGGGTSHPDAQSARRRWREMVVVRCCSRQKTTRPPWCRLWVKGPSVHWGGGSREF